MALSHAVEKVLLKKEEIRLEQRHEKKLEIAIQLLAGILGNPKVGFGRENETGMACLVVDDKNRVFSCSTMALDQAEILLAKWERMRK